MTNLRCFGEMFKITVRCVCVSQRSGSHNIWPNWVYFLLTPLVYPVVGLLIVSPVYGHWVNKGKKHGVSIWIASSAHGEMSIKAQCLVKTDLSSFVAIMDDLPGMPKWVAYSREVKILERLSATENLVYSSFNLPWPIQNRDMVTYSKWSEGSNGDLYLDVTDKGVHYPKVKGFTRMTHIDGHWSVIPLKNRMKVIQYEGQVNPGGWLPSWIVNQMRVQSTRKTMTDLCYRVAKSEYQHHRYSFIR
ncbi:MAG: hypothetical protein CENE_01487 [Candidatus Celerinatantimonas neptuna]|nr:MAG: hypothetical protein CENE_01487 [Candidatus Celerinatantimonas neptuna]